MKIVVYVIFTLSAVCGLSGDWELSEGTVFFTSIKNGSAPVDGKIPVTGTLSAQGIQAEVALSRLDTGNPLRDPNLRDVLFEAASHPSMKLSAGFPPRLLPEKVGGSSFGVLNVTVNYRGLTAEMELHVRTFRTGKDRFSMVSVKHETVTLKSLGLMGAPLEALIKICAHESVLPVAFVSFDGEWVAK